MDKPNTSRSSVVGLFLPVVLALLGSQAALAEVPVVTIRTLDATAAEPGLNTGAFTIVRTGSLDADLTVYYAVGGSASNGVDVVALPGNAVIAAGASNVAITVQPIDDLLAERTEYVSLSLKSNAGYAIGSPSGASVTVLDNDNLLPSVGLTVPTNGTMLTGPANVLVQALATDPDGWIRNVNFFANGSFIGGSGTGDSASNAAPPNTTSPYGVTWSNVLSGRFVLTATAYDNLGAMGTSAPIVVTVTLDPTVAVAKVVATDSTAAEPGADTGTFTVSRYGNTNRELTVYYTVAGTAGAGADYEALSGSVTIPANTLSATIPVRPIDDTKVEPTETVILSLVPDPTYFVSELRSASVYIRDNDTNTPPSVVLTTPSQGASFKDPSGIALAADAADGDGSVTRVEFYANTTLIATDTNSPYTATWSSVPAGVYALTAKATDNMGAATISQPVSVTVTRTPMVRLYVADSTAAEPGGDTATVQLYRYNNTNEALSVSYTVGGTADAGVDYEALSGSATIPAGVTVVPLVIRPIDDALLEPTETVVLTLSSNTAFAVTEPRTATVYIKDDEINTLPQVALTTPVDGAAFVDPTNVLLAATAGDADGTVTRVDFYANNVLVGTDTTSPYTAVWANMMQGAYALTAKATDNLGAAVTSQPVTVTVTRTPVVRMYATDSAASEPGDDGAIVQVCRYYNTNQDLMVYYTVAGTASNGTDYVALPGRVVIPAGRTSTNVVIRPVDDAMPEPTETVIMTLTSDQAYLVGDPRSAVAYIRDNETNLLPTVSLTSPADGAAFADPSNVLLSAQAADADGTIARVDFYANNVLVGTDTTSPYTAVWANMMQGVYVLTAKATDNLGAVVTSPPVRVTVTRTPVVRVFAPDAYASEPGDDGATIQICRYYNTNLDLVVNYTVGGTASSGTDYVALPTSVTIPAGRTSANLVIKPIDDTVPELTETVIVALSSNVAYAVLEPRSAVVYLRDNDTNMPPQVSLSAPAEGMEFRNPTSIVLSAEAADADGSVARVEFFANNALVGKCTNTPYTVRWSGMAQGAYTLTARAFDNLQACATSLPVNVTVIRTPLVYIYATDSHASEQGGDTGTFTVYRRESTNQSVTVSYAVAGTASNGTDYAALPGSVTIPPGVQSAAIVVQPLADGDTQEPAVETVTLSLLTDAAYQLTTATQATVYIYNEITTNVPPVVRVTEPTNGAAFNLPVSIVVKAEASDADGTIARVDFLVNSVVVATDTNAPYAAPWSTTAAGYYVLTAKAVDNRGAAVVSAPVRILAKVAPTPSARRYLPAGYVPGVKLLAMIAVSQPTVFSAYTVADRPPADWTVAGIGAGGVYDETEDVVRFGPYTTNSSQVLTYEVIPPDNATGTQTFAGTLITDGASVPVTGTASISPVPPHPADRAPADFVMTVDEAGAYCELWKNGTATTANDAAPSVSYVARSGYLSLGNGIYTISTNYPTPVAPMVWVTNAAAPPPPLYASTGYGTAVSAMPTNYTPGQPFTVTITVTPASPEGAYAIEEHLPSGWAVTNVSDAGVFSAARASVKWGLFLDGQPATVSYDVTPSTNTSAYGAFSGVTSFDGVNTPIGGIRKTYRSPW